MKTQPTTPTMFHYFVAHQSRQQNGSKQETPRVHERYAYQGQATIGPKHEILCFANCMRNGAGNKRTQATNTMLSRTSMRTKADNKRRQAGNVMFSNTCLRSKADNKRTQARNTMVSALGPPQRVLDTSQPITP